MCKGCNSDQPSPWCTDCELKTCCRNQDIRTCIECGEYPCDTLAAFIHNSEYPYHKDVPGMMARLMEVGLAAWAEEMDRQYTCDICGEKFSYFDGKCPRCADQ